MTLATEMNSIFPTLPYEKPSGEDSLFIMPDKSKDIKDAENLIFVAEAFSELFQGHQYEQPDNPLNFKQESIRQGYARGSSVDTENELSLDPTEPTAELAAIANANTSATGLNLNSAAQNELATGVLSSVVTAALNVPVTPISVALNVANIAFSQFTGKSPLGFIAGKLPNLNPRTEEPPTEEQVFGFVAGTPSTSTASIGQQSVDDAAAELGLDIGTGGEDGPGSAGGSDSGGSGDVGGIGVGEASPGAGIGVKSGGEIKGYQEGDIIESGESIPEEIELLPEQADTELGLDILGPMGLVNDMDGESDTGVADDLEMELEEGSFVLNSHTVELVGVSDLNKITKEAISVAVESGLKLPKTVDAGTKVPIKISNGEFVIPSVLVPILGVENLEKMNTRGLKYREKELAKNAVPEEKTQESVQSSTDELLSKIIPTGP